MQLIFMHYRQMPQYGRAGHSVTTIPIILPEVVRSVLLADEKRHHFRKPRPLTRHASRSAQCWQPNHPWHVYLIKPDPEFANILLGHFLRPFLQQLDPQHVMGIHHPRLSLLELYHTGWFASLGNFGRVRLRNNIANSIAEVVVSSRVDILGHAAAIISVAAMLFRCFKIIIFAKFRIMCAEPVDKAT